MYMSIYIYIYRERERDAHTYIRNTHVTCYKLVNSTCCVKHVFIISCWFI